MFNRNKLAGAFVAAVLAIGATTASAATIDFTAKTTGASGSGPLAGLTWSMSSNIGTVNNSQRFDGQGSNLSGAGLAFYTDGYGVRSYLDNSKNDDEITSMRKGFEAITLTFSRAVKLTGASFLDLFVGPNGFEEGYVETDDGTVIAISATDMANVGNSRRAGFASSTFAGIITTSVKFYIGLGNDPYGFADGALASVDIAPVPVPAAGLLMLGGLGGLFAVRRRKTA
jgi:hypothetical protein